MNGFESLQPIDDIWRNEEYGVIPAVDLQAIGTERARENVLQGVDLSVRERECFGIVGPFGGGKTTLLQVMMGLIPVKSGSVRLFGVKPTTRLRRRLPVGYLPQFNPIPEDAPATLWDYVCMGIASRGLFRTTPSENILYAENLLAALHLDHRMKQPVGRLSPGQQQRARIVRALVALPKFLVLDDPFQSLDPAGQETLIRLLADLRRRIHTTIVIASQDGKPLAPICNHVACLNQSILWVADCKDIDDEIWNDPCRYYPSREEEEEYEYEEPIELQPEHPSKPRTAAGGHSIQFWR